MLRLLERNYVEETLDDVAFAAEREIAIAFDCPPAISQQALRQSVRFC